MLKVEPGKVKNLAQTLKIPLGRPVGTGITDKPKSVELDGEPQKTEVTTKESGTQIKAPRLNHFIRTLGPSGRKPPTRKPRNTAQPTDNTLSNSIADAVPVELSEKSTSPDNVMRTAASKKIDNSPLSSTVSAGFFSSTPDNPKLQFLNRLLATLESKTSWDIKWNGGTTVKVNGTDKVMPVHAAEMYLACKDLSKDLSNEKINNIFNTVKGILEDAQHGNTCDNIFIRLWKLLVRTLARSSDTQTLYNEKEQEIRACPQSVSRTKNCDDLPKF